MWIYAVLKVVYVLCEGNVNYFVSWFPFCCILVQQNVHLISKGHKFADCGKKAWEQSYSV